MPSPLHLTAQNSRAFLPDPQCVPLAFSSQTVDAGGLATERGTIVILLRAWGDTAGLEAAKAQLSALDRAPGSPSDEYLPRMWTSWGGFETHTASICSATDPLAGIYSLGVALGSFRRAIQS